MGAWAVDENKNRQERLSMSTGREKEVMRRLTWKAAFVPAGTFLVWTTAQDDNVLANAYGIQVLGDVPGSGGCKSIAWFIQYGVSNWSGLLSALNGHQGGAYFLTAGLQQFAAMDHAGGGNIIVCPTKDRGSIELYAQHASWITIAMDHNPDLYVRAGFVRADPSRAAAWLAAEKAANRYIEKDAPPPPSDGWEPLPEPATHKQERLAAGG